MMTIMIMTVTMIVIAIVAKATCFGGLETTPPKHIPAYAFDLLRK